MGRRPHGAQPARRQSQPVHLRAGQLRAFGHRAGHAAARDSRIYWYQCDQIGAPLELTDAQGHIAWAADYKVWGEATLRSLPSQATGTDGMAGPRRQGHGPDAISPMRLAAPPLIEQPFRFQGQQFDEETGLHYNRFRYYDSVVRRFVSQDPIGLLGGVNSFTYAPSPNNWIDPFGLSC